MKRLWFVCLLIVGVACAEPLAMCTDWQSLMERTMYGQSEVWNAYASPNHPLHPADVAQCIDLQE